jgi:hypothetical protein
MDVSDASYYIFNEKENKGSQMGHTKKKKKYNQPYVNHQTTLIPPNYTFMYFNINFFVEK